MDLADEISEEYLSCSICLDPYKNPKQLPCLHSFCRNCLADHIVTNVPQGKTLSFTCPVCRKVIKPYNPQASRIKDWADDFPDNFFILGLMETLNTRGSKNVRSLQKTLSESSDFCSKHPQTKCDAYCTFKRVGVCDHCRLSEHRDCGDHHLDTDSAADMSSSKLRDFKRQMEKLREDVEKVREKFELSKPRELRLKKEELALKISEHFADLKGKFVKCLIQKEKEVVAQLADIIDNEKKGLSDSVDECSSLIKSFSGTVDLFEKLMTSSPINALTALYNMEEQMTSYATAVDSLQESSERCPVEYIPTVNEIEDFMSSIKIGELQVQDNTVTESGTTDADGPETSSTAQSEEEEDVCHTEAFEATAQALASAPAPSAPPPELPYSLQGFSVLSLQPRPGEDVGNWRQRKRAYEYVSSPTSPTYMSARSAQERPAYDLNITLWRSLAFFGNTTYSERRGGLVGITAVSKNICAAVDRFNNTVKIISTKGKIINALTFGNMDPWDIAYDKVTKHLVVTCPNQSFIVFVAEDTSRNSYFIDHTVQTKPYTSIAFLKGRIYTVGVCRPHGVPRVDIINSLGNILSYVDTSVQYPRALLALSDGKLVICDWTKKEVLMIGSSGSNNRLYHGVLGEELKEPMGLTKDSAGNIYVLDHKTKKVHILRGHDGACREVIPLEGVPDPRMICMVDSSRSGQSLVVLDSQNGVHVFSVEIPPPSPTQV